MNWTGGLNGLDFVLLLLILASLIVGFLQGMVRQVIGLAALYIATILAAQYYTHVGAIIRAITLVTSTSRFLNAVSFFLIVFVVWSVIAWLAHDTYRATKIKIIPLLDQFGGSLLGATTAIVALTMILPVLLFATGGESWLGGEGIRLILQNNLEGSKLLWLFESLKSILLGALAPWLPAGLPSIFNL